MSAVTAYAADATHLEQKDWSEDVHLNAAEAEVSATKDPSLDSSTCNGAIRLVSFQGRKGPARASAGISFHSYQTDQRILRFR